MVDRSGVADGVLDVNSQFAQCILSERREVIRGPQPLGRFVSLQHFASHGHLVYLGWSVHHAHDGGHRPQATERHFVGHAEGTVCVHGAPHGVVEHLGREHLDGGDVLARLAVVMVLVRLAVVMRLIDFPGGVEHQQAELLELGVGVGNVALYEIASGRAYFPASPY